MRELKVYCDRCEKEIKLHVGSEVQLSGNLIKFYRKQVGSIPTYEEYEVCGNCRSEIRKFIIGDKHISYIRGI